MSKLEAQDTVDYHIKFTWHNIFKMYNQIAKQYDLTQAIGFALLNIDDEKGTPATQISIQMGMEATSLSRLLRSMENKGLTYNERDAKDGRKVRIYLTDLGKEKRHISRHLVKEFNEKILHSLSKKKLDDFFDVMKTVNENIEAFKKEQIKEKIYEPQDK